MLDTIVLGLAAWGGLHLAKLVGYNGGKAVVGAISTKVKAYVAKHAATVVPAASALAQSDLAKLRAEFEAYKNSQSATAAPAAQASAAPTTAAPATAASPVAPAATPTPAA